MDAVSRKWRKWGHTAPRGERMSPSKRKWLPVVTLALVLAAPGLALGEAAPKTPEAGIKEQAASGPVEVIRGMSRTKVAYNSPTAPAAGPAVGGGANPPRRIYTVKVNNTPASNPCTPARSTPRRA